MRKNSKILIAALQFEPCLRPPVANRQTVDAYKLDDDRNLQSEHQLNSFHQDKGSIN